MSTPKILKLYDRAINKSGQTDHEFEVAKALLKREQERTNIQICKRKDGSLFARKFRRRIDTTEKCSVCNNEFKRSSGKSYSHNYGGHPKKNYVCSAHCLSVVSELLGLRISKKPAYLWGRTKPRRAKKTI